MKRALQSKLRLPPHSTRLFPKNHGATAYAITGIAAYCDWILLSDCSGLRTYLHHNRNTNNPRFIFLSLRSPFDAIQTFAQEVLPQLGQPFILISGSEDITLPKQTDTRWRKYNKAEAEMIDLIMNHSLLEHWYIENLDSDTHPRCSPLPLGMVFPHGAVAEVTVPSVPALSTRSLNVFCSHRHREGPQWQPRRDVSALARSTTWREFCTVLDDEISETDFQSELKRHSFVLCVEGGGLDPSPKAWESILHGAIPIIRKTALARAYGHLPVVMVDQWNINSISISRLKAWRNILSPWYDDPERRREVLKRLSIDYWWKAIATREPISSANSIAITNTEQRAS